MGGKRQGVRVIRPDLTVGFVSSEKPPPFGSRAATCDGRATNASPRFASAPIPARLGPACFPSSGDVVDGIERASLRRSPCPPASLAGAFRMADFGFAPPRSVMTNAAGRCPDRRCVRQACGLAEVGGAGDVCGRKDRRESSTGLFLGEIAQTIVDRFSASKRRGISRIVDKGNRPAQADSAPTEGRDIRMEAKGAVVRGLYLTNLTEFRRSVAGPALARPSVSFEGAPGWAEIQLP